MKNLIEDIPFLGIVSVDGYIESYDYKTAEECDFHHSFALTEKGCEVYESDDTLRFVMYKGTNKYNLLGEPALDPFDKGRKQIKLFVKHVLDNGASEETEIEVAQHQLNTEWEGRVIGRLKDWK